MTAAAPSNPYALRARTAKAIAMADYVWRHLSDDLRDSIGLCDALRGMLPDQRLHYAKAAGVHAASRPDTKPPSDETWDLFVGRIHTMQRWRREEQHRAETE